MSPPPDEELLAPGVVEAVATKPWPVVVAAVAAVAVAVLATVFVLPERYTASATVTIADPQQAAFTTGGALTADYERYLASAASFAESALVFDTAAGYLGGADPDSLEAAVSVRADGTDRALEVSATGPSGRTAAERANAVVDAFEAEHADHLAAQSEQTIRALDEQIEAVQADIDDARARLADNPDDGAARASLDEASALLRSLRERSVELTVNTSSYGSGVQLVDPATIPSSPSSPNLRLNAAIGLLVGILGGAAFVWFRADRARPLGSSDEPRSLIDIPLLGKIPEMESGSGPLNDPKAMPSDAYQFVASALRATLGDAGRVVLVGGVGEGAGTTVTASNLAVAAARDELTVAVVDACADEGLAELFRRPRMQPGILDLVSGSDGGVDRQRLTWALGPVSVDGRSVRFLAYGTSDRSSAANELRSSGARAVIDELRYRFDIVFIDCGSVVTSPAAGALAPAADALVLTIRNGTHSDVVVEARERLAVERVPIAGYVYTHADPAERRRFRAANVDVGDSSPGPPADLHAPRRPEPLPPSPTALPPAAEPRDPDDEPDVGHSGPPPTSADGIQPAEDDDVDVSDERAEEAPSVEPVDRTDGDDSAEPIRGDAADPPRRGIAGTDASRTSSPYDGSSVVNGVRVWAMPAAGDNPLVPPDAEPN